MFDVFSYWLGKRSGNGGGGSKPILKRKDIYENGDYYATEDGADGYSAVSVGIYPQTKWLTCTQNGTYNISQEAPGYDGWSRVDVKVPIIDENLPVLLVDYDGTVLHSYSTQDFARLNTLPANPDHTDIGLTAQGWNWTLSSAKTYVGLHGYLTIGQMYSTTSGAIEIDVSIQSENQLKCSTAWYFNGTFSVDWGDGTTPDTATGSSFDASGSNKRVTHTYAQTGDYTIKISKASGSGVATGYKLDYISNVFSYDTKPTYWSSSGTTSDYDPWLSCVTAIRLPSWVRIGHGYAFAQLRNLRYITMPPGDITSAYRSYDSVFANCYSLTCLVLPKGYKWLGMDSFSDSGLRHLSFPMDGSSNADWTGTGGAFGYMPYLKRLCIPTNFFPSGTATYKKGVGGECLEIVRPVSTFNDGTPIYKSNAMKEQLPLANNTTSLADGYMQNRKTVEKVTVPASVTSIGIQAFSNCSSLSEIHLEPTTPPTAGSSAFGNIPRSCKIYVPTGSLSAYTSAANYPASSTYGGTGYLYVEE